ncbi:transcriptional regulator swi6, partial [Rhizophlyctis rosea]
MSESLVPGQIYSAIYSGVPVYEMVTNGVPVMRRMSDGFLNATQILKVAGFNKPKRTKIIEREVLSGDHQKIQGGYGKYQGTWLPLREGKELAEKYHVEEQLRPLIEYDPSVTPPVPRPAVHRPSSSDASTPGVQSPITLEYTFDDLSDAESNTNQSDAATVSDVEATSSEEEVVSATRAAPPPPQPQTTPPQQSESQATTPPQYPFLIDSFFNSNDGSSALAQQFLTDLYGRDSQLQAASSSLSYLSGNNTQQASQASQASQAVQSAYHLAMLGLLSAAAHQPFSGLYPSTDSFYSGLNSLTGANANDTLPKLEELQPVPPQATHPEPAPSRKDRRKAKDAKRAAQTEAEEAARRAAQEDQRRRDILMNLYMHGDDAKKEIIKLLMDPTAPEKIEVNLSLDQDGGTALQYAATWGAIGVVKALIHQGADIDVRKRGETALMQAITSTNNFDLQTFPDLLAVLQELVYKKDDEGHTILHYVAEATSVRSNWPAAHYYARCLGEFLHKDRHGGRVKRYRGWLNAKDKVNGDTALHLACRNGSRLVVEILLRLGVDQEEVNFVGLTAVDVARHDTYMLRTLSLQGEKDDEVDYSEDSDFFYSSDDDGDSVRSPSPNPVEQSLHTRMMQRLGNIYGDRVSNILDTLMPSFSSRSGDETITGPHAALEIQATPREIEFARTQLQAAETEFRELREQRRHLEEMFEYAKELEQMLVEEPSKGSRKRKAGGSGGAGGEVGGEVLGRKRMRSPNPMVVEGADGVEMVGGQSPVLDAPSQFVQPDGGAYSLPAYQPTPERPAQQATHLATPATSPVGATDPSVSAAAVVAVAQAQPQVPSQPMLSEQQQQGVPVDSQVQSYVHPDASQSVYSSDAISSFLNSALIPFTDIPPTSFDASGSADPSNPTATATLPSSSLPSSLVLPPSDHQQQPWQLQPPQIQLQQLLPQSEAQPQPDQHQQPPPQLPSQEPQPPLLPQEQPQQQPLPSAQQQSQQQPQQQPAKPTRPTARSSETRMKAELADLQEQVAKSERNRQRMWRDLCDVRARREGKDRKFRKIIAACLGVGGGVVEGIVRGLEGEGGSGSSSDEDEGLVGGGGG